MRVYIIEWLESYRDWSTKPPGWENLVLSGFYWNACQTQAHNWWIQNKIPFRFDTPTTSLLLYREFYRLKYVKGFSSDVALTGAKVNVQNYFGRSFKGVPCPAILMWSGLLIAGIIFSLWEAAGADKGYNHFGREGLFLRWENRVWWGGLVAHLSPGNWTFKLGPEIGDLVWSEERLYFGRPYGIDWWYFGGTWTDIVDRVIFHWLYVRSMAELSYIGVAHDGGGGYYEMQRPLDMPEPWNYPVGWSRHAFDSLEYVDNLHDNFVSSGF